MCFAHFQRVFKYFFFFRFILYKVIEELNAFKTENSVDITAYVDRNLKMVAFNFAKRSNQPTFFKLMANIYELIQNNEMFVGKIRELIAEHNYKDVSVCYYFLNKPRFHIL